MATGTRSPHHPSGRTLHLLDVENLAGGTAAGLEAIAPSLAAYRATVRVAPGDHVVLGTGVTPPAPPPTPGRAPASGSGTASTAPTWRSSPPSTPASPPPATTGW